MNQEAEKAAFELLKSKPAQWVIVGGVAIYLLPRAMGYLADHIEQGTSYLLGAAWKGVTGKVGEAEDLVAANATWTKKQFDNVLTTDAREEAIKILDDALTPETRDQKNVDDYKKQMNIPPSAFFIAVPQNLPQAIIILRTGDWSSYGIRIINSQHYIFLLPATISLVTVKEEIQTEDADEKGNCRSGWKRQYGDAGKFRELCTRTVEVETVVPPLLSGSEAKGRSTLYVAQRMYGG